MNKKPSAAESALQKGITAGSLTFKERKDLEDEVRKEFAAEFGYKAQLKGMLKDSTVGGQVRPACRVYRFSSTSSRMPRIAPGIFAVSLTPTVQAIEIPARFTSAFLASTFVQLLLTISFVETFDAYRSNCDYYAEQLQDILLSTAAGVYLYGNLTGGDNLYQDSSKIKDLVDALVRWQPIIDNLGDALWASSLVGIIAALVVHMISWVVLMLDFRSSALQMRRGIYYFEPKKLKFRQSFTFLGAAVSTNMLVFLLWWLLFFLFTFIFAWKFTFDLMCDIIAALWIPIITWLVSYIINYALTYFVTGYVRCWDSSRGCWIHIRCIQWPVFGSLCDRLDVTRRSTSVTRGWCTTCSSTLPRVSPALRPPWCGSASPSA